jgi:hypothetical protein
MPKGSIQGQIETRKEWEIAAQRRAIPLKEAGIPK